MFGWFRRETLSLITDRHIVTRIAQSSEVVAGQLHGARTPKRNRSRTKIRTKLVIGDWRTDCSPNRQQTGRGAAAPRPCALLCLKSFIFCTLRYSVLQHTTTRHNAIVNRNARITAAGSSTSGSKQRSRYVSCALGISSL